MTEEREIDEGLCNNCNKLYEFVAGEDTGICEDCTPKPEDESYNESLVASATPDPADKAVFRRAEHNRRRREATARRRAEELEKANKRTHDAIASSAAQREEDRASKRRARKPQLRIV